MRETASQTRTNLGQDLILSICNWLDGSWFCNCCGL